MQKDPSLMPFAIVTIQPNGVKLTRFEPWSTQWQLMNIPTRPLWLSEMKSGVFAQSIYTLKLEIAHSGPGNLKGDKTVYIITHEHLIKYLGVVWGVANCNTTSKKLPLLHSTNNFGCEISIKQKIATASRFKRNWLNQNCSTTLHYGGFY